MCEIIALNTRAPIIPIHVAGYLNQPNSPNQQTRRLGATDLVPPGQLEQNPITSMAAEGPLSHRSPPFQWKVLASIAQHTFLSGMAEQPRVPLSLALKISAFRKKPKTTKTTTPGTPGAGRVLAPVLTLPFFVFSFLPAGLTRSGPPGKGVTQPRASAHPTRPEPSRAELSRAAPRSSGRKLSSCCSPRENFDRQTKRTDRSASGTSALGRGERAPGLKTKSWGVWSSELLQCYLKGRSGTSGRWRVSLVISHLEG